MAPNPNGYIYKITLVPKAQGFWFKRRQKDCKSLIFREFAVRWLILDMSEATPVKISSTRMPRHELNKDINNRLGKVDGRKPTRPQNYTKNFIILKLLQSTPCLYGLMDIS